MDIVKNFSMFRCSAAAKYFPDEWLNQQLFCYVYDSDFMSFNICLLHLLS